MYCSNGNFQSMHNNNNVLEASLNKNILGIFQNNTNPQQQQNNNNADSNIWQNILQATVNK